MTNEEALIVLKIMSTADHGCSSCVQNLFAKFLIKYPDKLELAKNIWDEAFDHEEFDWEEEIRLQQDED